MTQPRQSAPRGLTSETLAEDQELRLRIWPDPGEHLAIIKVRSKRTVLILAVHSRLLCQVIRRLR